MDSPAYYNPRADLLVMPSNPIMYQDRLIDPKQIEAHEYCTQTKDEQRL
jgi:hypothetical protein